MARVLGAFSMRCYTKLMDIDYILVASILLYAFVARGTINHSLGILFPSLIVTIVPLLLHTALKLIILSGKPDTPLLPNLFTIETIVQAIAQLIVAYGVFYVLRKLDETIMAWYLMLIVGGAAIYIGIPLAVSRLPL